MTPWVLCTSRGGTGWCEGLGSSVFRQRMWAWSWAARERMFTHGCTCSSLTSGMELTLVMFLCSWGLLAPLGSGLFAQPAIPCLCPRILAADALLHSVPAGRCCAGLWLLQRCPSPLPQFTALKFQFNTHAKRAAINLVVSIKYCLF